MDGLEEEADVRFVLGLAQFGDANPKHIGRP